MTSTLTSEPADRAAITVEYQSKRGEVWRRYWRSWARPDGLWRFHALWGLMAAGMFAFFEAPRHVSVETFGRALMAGRAIRRRFRGRDCDQLDQSKCPPCQNPVVSG